MKTIIKKTSVDNIDMDTINQAGEIIRQGGLVAFPTETVYGLGADALNEEAAAKIYAGTPIRQSVNCPHSRFGNA